VTFLRERIAEHGDASLACEELLESNLKDPRGTDNMTAVVMELKREYLHEGITLGETAET
jgi:serine/threonine protein phosphatase PrpC